ncbi:MAG: MraY family glycosyltransferase [Cyanobacteriota bacterium]|nr:MraY family glycosyltransferase [Cyanobacteriota bacterium]
MNPSLVSIPLLQAASVAFLLTALVIGLLVPWAGHLGLIDHPGGRKRHRRPVPMVGGIAIFVAVTAATHAFALSPHPMWPLTLAAVWMLVVGIADDRHDILPITRLINQCALALLLAAVSGYRVESLGNLFGFGDIALGWLGVPMGILAAVALTNAFNMLDGLDGLAAGVALTTFLAILALAVEDQRWVIAVSSAAMVGALVGFLLFNLPFAVSRKHLVFMGDGGSTMVGMLAAVSLLALLVQGSLPNGWADPSGVDTRIAVAGLLWLVAIPVFEIVTSTLRRVRQGLSPFAADNGHYHHRLRQAHWPVRLIFLFYMAFSVAMMVAGLSLHRMTAPEPLMFFGFLAAYGLFHGIVATAARYPFPEPAEAAA